VNGSKQNSEKCYYYTYQQDFHGAPNPKKSIKLGAHDKQGRYVRIQLLDNNYLSLAEVQVMGVDNLPPSALFLLGVCYAIVIPNALSIAVNRL
jgi:hypothetical protein